MSLLSLLFSIFLLGNGKIRSLTKAVRSKVALGRRLRGVGTMVEAEAAGIFSWQIWFDMMVFLSNVKHMLFFSLFESGGKANESGVILAGTAQSQIFFLFFCLL
ncbi:hypothetical protein NE237_030234 [Protea cynaroides]|uniref:Secreted protein n=1 Tax=Protea cynaroides TaxID=273540 RepID=A0A9Q0JVV6_9MAGN|nr:hypothetical protein NE237_030234 [Protea cynaroides]